MNPIRLLALCLCLSLAGSCTNSAGSSNQSTSTANESLADTANQTLPSAVTGTSAGATTPAATGQTNKFDHITVDVAARQVRVQCQALHVTAPLEFLCVRNGGPEHEALLRTAARPSDIHLGLLMLGLQPGKPFFYSEPAKRWFAPSGPPLRLTLEFEKDGRQIRGTANRFMRDVQTHQPMPDLPWIFVGSQIMDDGTYAANLAGYVVSTVNFELTVIDVPALRSSANDTLEWEADLDALPAEGTPVTMIIEPVGQDEQLSEASAPTASTVPPASAAPEKSDSPSAAPTPAATTAATTSNNPEPIYHGLQPDQQRLDALKQRWEKAVRPSATTLQSAAQAHYDVIMSLRQEQQRLIEEADRIQRLIDDLDRQYQDITTPHPSTLP